METYETDIDTDSKNPYEGLNDEGKFAAETAKKVAYAGLFVDREELYRHSPAHLKNTIDNPHVTTNFAPNETQLHLEELGSKARIIAIGYGNNGKNEGLLVRVETDDPVIQKAVDGIKVPHITLSYSDDSHPKDTSSLDFTPIEEPFELDGEYCLYLKRGFYDKTESPLVNDIKSLKSPI